MPDDAEQIICNTTILQMLNSILRFATSDELIYYLKLEAIWLLTNLAYFDDVNTNRILLSTVELTEI